MNKVFYVVLDGLGDEPIAELGDRTPLEAARTPHLDRLASEGRNGLVYTVGKGIAPESDIAVFAVLGYDPRVYHSGRGPLEAHGCGIEVRDGDLAYRVNFATVDAEWNIVDRRVGRNLTSEEAGALAEDVNRAVKLPGAASHLRATVEHRGVVHMRRDGAPLSAEVTNTDPAYGREGALGVAKETFEEKVQECRPIPGHENEEPARAAAELTNEYLRRSHAALESSVTNAKRRAQGRLVANMILTRDGGDHLPRPPAFRERYGASWGCFVEMPVERGIALVLGMGEVPVAQRAGTFAGQYSQWAATALDAIDAYDGLYVHIKGPDVPAHDGRARDKLEVIEAIDEAFFGGIAGKLPRGSIVAVTADHATSCARKAHTDDPVPLIVWGAGISSDGARAFGEREAQNGSLGLLQGVDIMPRLMDAARGT